jgi:HK97 gp10 family phage protein
MYVNLSFDGGDQLARNLRALTERVEKKTVREALVKGAEPIRGMASALMTRSKRPHIARPQTKRHGAMGASHAAEHVEIAVGRSGHSVAIGPGKDWWYWLFAEFGTVRMSPRPALRPAFAAQGPNTLNIVRRELWDAVQDEAAKNVGTIGGSFV